MAIVESFSHSVVLDTDDGLVAVDASGAGWSSAPVRHLVYTHGHADHVGGSRAFAERWGELRVVGDRNVRPRFDRYGRRTIMAGDLLIWYFPNAGEPQEFGGWWDGAASRLKPSPDAELAGGPAVLTSRALDEAEAGNLRLACHLVDLAAWAAPDDPAVHDVRARVHRTRRSAERSLMSKGIFAAAARESEAIRDAAGGADDVAPS